MEKQVDFEKELVTLLARKSSDLGVLPTKFGFVVKQGHVIKSWKKRWLVLCRLSLLYFKDMNSPTAQGGVSLAGVAMNMQNGVLYLSCPVSFIVKKNGMTRFENRTLALKGNNFFFCFFVFSFSFVYLFQRSYCSSNRRMVFCFQWFCENVVS
jgi:hypothetical protein